MTEKSPPKNRRISQQHQGYPSVLHQQIEGRTQRRNANRFEDISQYRALDMGQQIQGIAGSTPPHSFDERY